MTNPTLFEPYTLGSLTLSNRIVMAPLTRNRAGSGFVPGDLTAEYYSQRASTGRSRDVAPFDFGSLRGRFNNTYIANNGYDLELAAARLAEGKADLFAFGRPFIANPDLVERLKTSAPLAAFDQATLYGGGSAGYTDYNAIAMGSQS